MPTALKMRFDRRPSPAAYMLRALAPLQRRHRSGGFPPVHASWNRHRIDRRHLAEFLRLTGLRTDRGLPVLYPHVFGFPLQMAILTHPAFPLPIWNSLQIRNHLIRHRPIPADAVVDLETRVADQRILEKGVEVDLRTCMRARDEPVWESLNTFYYRGRHGEAGPASTLARAPSVRGEVLAQWHMAAGPGWRFGGLTGDYNGIHWSRWYARVFGFRQAFHHPQLVIGQCLAHLPEPDPAEAERLDVWLKGPVYYGSDVRLSVAAQTGSTAFALAAAGEERPAILGCWRRAWAPESLLLPQPVAEDRNGFADGRLGF